MKKSKDLIMILGLFLLILVTSTVFYKSVSAATDTTPVHAPQNIRVYKHSITSIKIKWKTVADVDGYIVYRYNNSSKKYVKIHTVKHAAKEKEWIYWIDEGLETNKVYKYKVAAYASIDGKKQISKLSDWVSAKTYKKDNKNINAKAPKASKKKVVLGLCSAEKVRCQVNASKFGKSKKKKAFSKKIRWYSTNPSIAKVNKNGVITAGVKEGNCCVYAISHNGARTKIKVVVKNFARVGEYYNYGDEIDIYTLITEYKTQIQNIAEYYSINRPKEDEVIKFDLNDDAKVVITPSNADIGNLQRDIETLLVDFPYYISIKIDAGCVSFVLRKEDSNKSIPGYVRFFFDQDWEGWSVQIASHWIGYRFYNGD